jgi:hypothetical protein
MNLTPIAMLRSLGSGIRNLIMKTTMIRFIMSIVESKVDQGVVRGIRCGRLIMS